ncbi:MAG TPA: M43 family zinc metalloprotease [Bacteroidia bacterium]|jgi:hypothetical protein
MKKNLLLSLGLAALAIAQAGAQTLSTDHLGNQELCGQMQHLADMKMKDPGMTQRMADFENQIQQWISAHPQQRQEQTVITIPVCVHVVYNLTSQNVTDPQVMSQIQVLNEDFGRTNPDANQTPAAWTGIAANTGVQFCLAQRDPNGNPSTGIERRQTSVTSFSQNDAVKFYAQGGLDIWDPTRYMNIWVCWFGNSGLLGYGEFPTASVSNTFGVVIDYEVFGSNYTNYGTFPLFNGYDKGRTTTHEFSHCFNLFHIWGDDGTACTGTDYCADTPNQGGPTSGCFTYPHTDACSPSNPGIMFMNYMDYSQDNCKNLFTNNQSTRINAVLNTSPYNALATSNGCTPVNLATNDAAVVTITTPNGNVCGSSFTPVITIKNWGSNTLTSCVINYKIDLNTPTTQNWSGSLASLATTQVTLGSMTTTSGAHTFTAYTSLPNNTTDGQPSNDQMTSNFTAYTVGASLPLVEGFESSTNIPAGWSLGNTNNDATWQISTTVARTGVHSMLMNNCDGDGTGDMTGTVDWAKTMPLNFTNMANGTMTFDVAYCIATYQSTNYTDTLVVYYSTNCGATWTQIYRKGGTTLATAPPYTITQNSACWSPPGPTSNQWRNESITLPVGVNNQPNVMFAFKNISDWGEQLFIDNVNINAVLTGVPTAENPNAFNIFPNPSNGTFNISGLGHSGKVHYFIFNEAGQEVRSGDLNPGSSAFNESITVPASAGVYFIRITDDASSCVKKLIIQ